MKELHTDSNGHIVATEAPPIADDYSEDSDANSTRDPDEV